MRLRNLLHPFYSLAAVTCEKSRIAANLVRKIDFRSKGLVVQRIRPDPDAPEVIATCNGVRYRLDLRDDIQREIYFNTYERKDLLQALSLIPVGGTCIDVGANNGAFALQFAKKVGDAGVVHAFEPDPLIFARLSFNCVLNGFQKTVKCYQKAVSNINDTVSFYRSRAEHSGWGSLVEFPDIVEDTEKVETITLDSFVAGQRLRNVDFLKVDVEAHEAELLNGAKRSLAEQLFRFILIEFNGIRLIEQGKSLNDFFDPLTAAGYIPIRIRVDLLHKLRLGFVPPQQVCTNFLFAAGNCATELNKN